MNTSIGLSHWLMRGASILALVFLLTFVVNAETTTDQYTELQLREKQKAELQQKISSLRSQEKSLANQITYLENRIQLTKLEQEDTRDQIAQTEELINSVNGSIDSLTEKLANLSNSIIELSNVLSLRIRTTYQLEVGGSGAGVFLDSSGFRQLILQSAYLRRLQLEDKKLLAQMNGTRASYEVEKQQLEDLKEEKETLRNQLVTQNEQLEQQKADLANQQAAKSWLLATTQNEEAKYKTLLAQMEEEIRAIKAALTSLGTKIGAVKKGDIIGHLGNTGCSTGAHVHFGYYVSGVATNPKPFLDSGVLGWPLKDPVVTQWYGENYEWYLANFSMAGHNGIDLVDGTVGYGAPILAAADGTAYAVSDSQKCWLTGTVGKGVRIDHPDGTKTIYWHLQ